MKTSMHGVILGATVIALPCAVHAQEVSTVKLGFSAPLSGAQAHYGRDNQNGVQMAIDDLNAKGVRIAGKPVRFELVAQDDAADPKQALAVAQLFCDQKVSGVVGHSNSGPTIVASRIYNDCAIPHITPSATNPKLTEQGFNTSFRLLANDNALGAAVADYAAKTLKMRKVAVIDDRTAYGQGVAQVFRDAAKKNGIEVVSEQFTTDKSVDFASILTAVKSKAPEAIFYGGMDPQAGPMLRQMQQLGMSKIRLLGGDSICTEKITELSGNAPTVNNVVCAEGGASLEKMPGGPAWKARYDLKYPGQFQLYSPYTYDATMLLADAMVRASSSDPKVYLPFLRQADYKGVTALVRFEKDGELHKPSITLFRFSNGKKAPL